MAERVAILKSIVILRVTKTLYLWLEIFENNSNIVSNASDPDYTA
jgi:hypothetical protein